MNIFRSLFKNPKKNINKGFALPRMETLEDRSVPATAVLNSGILSVIGTNAPDRITINLDSVNNQIVVINGNQETGRFNSDSVNSIHLFGGAGNDSLQVSSQIIQPAFIDGESGNDRVFGGGGGSTITGGKGANRMAGGTGNDTIFGQGKFDIIGSPSGVDLFTGGPGINRFFGYALNSDGGVQATITNLSTNDLDYLLSQAPPDLSSTLNIQPSQNVVLSNQINGDMEQGDVAILLKRAAAATKSEDGIIAIVDRQGRILGVQVEGGVNSKMNPKSPDFDKNLFVFAVDGAVALARTGGMFGNNQAPLTSRTIGYISQTTVTEREVNSYPSDTDENSIFRGPGYVAAVGIGSHFPPLPSTNGEPNGIAFTPQVDLFGIEQTNRDGTYNPGLDRIKGTADDVFVPFRFNIDPTYIPGDILSTFYLSLIHI